MLHLIFLLIINNTVVQFILDILKFITLIGLWRGLEGTIPRTAVASSAQLSTFGKSKQLLENQSPVCMDHFVFFFL